MYRNEIQVFVSRPPPSSAQKISGHSFFWILIGKSHTKSKETQLWRFTKPIKSVISSFYSVFGFSWYVQSNWNCAFHFKCCKPWLDGALLFWQRHQCLSTFCRPMLFQLRKKLSGKHSLKLSKKALQKPVKIEIDHLIDFFFLFHFLRPMVNCWTSLLLNIKPPTPNLWIWAAGPAQVRMRKSALYRKIKAGWRVWLGCCGSWPITNASNPATFILNVR